MTAQLSFDDAAANADPVWESCALQAIRVLARRGEPFQSYDLVTEFGLVEPDDSHRWGPLFAKARSQGLIRKLSPAPSKRPSVAGSLVWEWVGVGVAS